MSYQGDTFTVYCNAVGFNGNQNTDAIGPDNMVSPSKNVNLMNGGVGKRGGTAHVNGTAVDSGQRLMGVHVVTPIGGSRSVVVGTANGKIIQNYTTELKTSWGTDKHHSYAKWNDILYITNGNNTPQTWNGSAGTTSDLGNLAADWTGTNFPTQFVVHGRANSERMWAFKSPTTPKSIYYSADNSGSGDPNFSTGGIITIETGDEHGLVGGVEFADRLIAFGKRKAYILLDSDATPSNWGYSPAAWEGGGAHNRVIVKTPNDIIAMMEDGEIYSVTGAQEYGDYKYASLTRPSFMHAWIADNIDLTKMANFHGVYDPVLKCVKYFVTRTGQTNNDVALVFFLNRPIEKAWAIHDNLNSVSGYSASSSALVTKSDGSYAIYTGDYAGFVWELNKANKNDNNNAIDGRYKTPHMNFGNQLARMTKRYDRGWVIMPPQGNYNLGVNVTVDGVGQITTTVDQSGTGGSLDSFTLDTDVLGGNEFLDQSFDIGVMGKRIQLEFYNQSVNEDFFVSSFMVDFKPIGAKPSVSS